MRGGKLHIEKLKKIILRYKTTIKATINDGFTMVGVRKSIEIGGRLFPYQVKFCLEFKSKFAKYEEIDQIMEELDAIKKKEMLVNTMELKKLRKLKKKSGFPILGNVMNEFDEIENEEKLNEKRIQDLMVMELRAVRKEICKGLNLNINSDEIVIEEMPVNTEEWKQFHRLKKKSRSTLLGNVMNECEIENHTVYEEKFNEKRIEDFNVMELNAIKKENSDDLNLRNLGSDVILFDEMLVNTKELKKLRKLKKKSCSSLLGNVRKFMGKMIICKT